MSRTGSAPAIPEGDDLLARAEAVVAKAVAAGAAQAECWLEAGGGLDVEVEADAVSSAQSVLAQGGAVRVVRDGRIGFAYFAQGADAPRAIEAALAAAQRAPRKAYSLPGAPAGGLPRLPPRWDDAMAALNEQDALRLARDILQGAREGCRDASVVGGGAGLSWGVEAVASSEGVAAWDRATQCAASASMTVADGGSAITAWDHEEMQVGPLDAHAMAMRLGERLTSLRGPRDAVAGVQDVILLPDAAGELVADLVLAAVDGDTACRGKSVWSESLGRSVAHPGLSIVDDPLRPDALGTVPFDGDGLPVRTQPIVADGVLRLFLFDSYHGHLHGQRTTHHAVRGGFKDPPGVDAHNVVVTHKETQPLDDLVAGVEEGCLVESLLGAHTANATTGDFSVTAPNVWRIEGGAVVGPSREVAIAGNLHDLLGRLDAVSDAPRRREGLRMPALRLRDVKVSA